MVLYNVFMKPFLQSNGTLERGRSPRVVGQYNTPQAMYSEVSFFGQYYTPQTMYAEVSFFGHTLIK